jgi:hypothetical protein
MITSSDYIYPRWRGFEVKPSLSADREMRRLGLYLDDVITVLEEGKDCTVSRRKTGLHERARKIHGKMIKVVVVESTTRWNNEPCWLITHVGRYHEK